MSRFRHKQSVQIESDIVGRVEILISNLLRIGVIASLLVLLTGLLLMFVHHPSYIQSGADFHNLTTPGAAFPHSIHDVSEGIVAGRGQAVVTLGLLLLIITPILRVAVSIVAFAIQRDRVYVVITSAVLLILMASFLLGKIE